MSNKDQNKNEELQGFEQALSSSEAFIEKYQKQLLMGVAAVIILILGVLAFRNFYQNPREIAAENEMYRAQLFFATDSFKLALNGDGNTTIGFKNIASDYSITKSGNLAAAYAGICYFHLGEYDNAIKFLSQYDGKDNYFKTSIIGMIGDAYVELNELSKALNYFDKAAKMKNEVLSPVYLKKAGIVHESQKEFDKAEKAYVTIKENYPSSAEASDIEKYIARVQKN